MIEEIEKLIKIQGILNKDKYHLCVQTDLEKESAWYLYLVGGDFKEYLGRCNDSIMSSQVDSIDDLIKYLENHDGFRHWF